ncbi:MAG TPA: serine/threonine-protein kinase, partial [Bryobacteraceae bacterium]|nr:serine/threonine-protein kinase [Bryobacteraceae bacterium]
MTPEQARAVEDLFASASVLPPEDRRAFLARACPDFDLRTEVESLLKWHDLAEAEPSVFDVRPPPEAKAMLARLAARTFILRQLSELKQVGPFQLGNFLGEGSTGVVYRAFDTRSGVNVALKIAFPESMMDEKNRSRFERAAAASMRLDHPNIARTLEICTVRTPSGDDLICVVLEYVDGRTLAEQLRIGRADPADALRWARQTADALDSAHRHGIIHRDLKPANIMLTAS